MIVLICNSDIGAPGQLGIRVEMIGKELQRQGLDFKIFARTVSKRTTLKTHVEWSIINNILNKVLTAYYKRFNNNFDLKRVKQVLFDFFVLRRLDHTKASLIHSWEQSRHLQHLTKSVIYDIAMAPTKPLPQYVKRGYFFAPSNFVKEKLLEQGIKRNRIFVVPFGVELKKFRPGKDGKKCIFLFVGTLSKRKGIHLLLKAWQELNLSNAELRLCGLIHSDFRKEIKQYRSKSLKLLGHLDEEELIQQYQEANIFVLPTFLEGSAKVVYEAMSSGLPVITTPNAGSIIRHGYDGIIIALGNLKELKKWMRELYKKSSLRKELGLAARKSVRKYTWNAYARRIVKKYKLIKE